MERKKLSYKYCLVPMCTNTTIKTPNKNFFHVPTNMKIRQKWCIAIKRDKTKNKLSATTALYCCEDHFNLEEDMDNYIEHKIMKNVNLRLKNGVIPHIFECQKRNKAPSIIRKGILKRQRLQLIKEAMAAADIKQIEDINIRGTEDRDTETSSLSTSGRSTTSSSSSGVSDSSLVLLVLVVPQPINTAEIGDVQPPRKYQYKRCSLGLNSIIVHKENYPTRMKVLEENQIPETMNCDMFSENYIKSELTETMDCDMFTENYIKSELTETMNCDMFTENYIKSELMNESSLEESDYDYQQKSDLRLQNEYNKYYKSDNTSIVQIRQENEHLKRSLMLEEHQQKMKLLKLQRYNELLKNNLKSGT